jgi:hypothetical protein
MQKDTTSHVLSWQSISATSRFQDIISLVIHKMGIIFGSYLGTCALRRVHEYHSISW